MIELLHFLLGGSGDTLPADPAVRDTTFRLKLDWPGVADSVTVERTAARSGSVTLTPPCRILDSLSTTRGWYGSVSGMT